MTIQLELATVIHIAVFLVMAATLLYRCSNIFRHAGGDRFGFQRVAQEMMLMREAVWFLLYLVVHLAIILL